MFMRYHKVHRRDPRSIVQITNVPCCKDLVRNAIQKKDVQLAKGTSGTFDFEDQRQVNWDAPYIDEASNLIEQSFMKDVYVKHLHPEKVVATSEPSGEPSPVSVPDPAATPSQE